MKASYEILEKCSGNMAVQYCTMILEFLHVLATFPRQFMKEFCRLCPGDDRDVTAVPVKLCARVARLMGRSLRDVVFES